MLLIDSGVTYLQLLLESRLHALEEWRDILSRI